MPTNPLALIVDDEPDIRELIELTLKRMGIDTHSAADVTSAKSLLDKQHFDLCLTDMRLPDGNGIDLIRHIQQHSPDTPTAMITAHGNMQAAVEALKAGAFDFVSKPVELKVLRDLVNSALKLSDQTSKPDRRSRHTLLGESPQMQTIRGTITKLARSQAPVYISGESGTGKELVARLVHEKGPRVDNNFVPVNCGAIPGELMESELFGHKKGSFTGANADKQGLFQAADGGTLFLDEIGALSLAIQAKMLRALQSGEIQRVGSDQYIQVDVRIVAATNRDLQQEVSNGNFRADLYHRLTVYPVQVPPLRERGKDILLLA
ncbi:MAG: sigma-54-dependent Fis family transcriptional regulator, partial [Gammaproteobacteria bacterium]|nr:sigma-54-dependent Fis family transcriptional regulator [Gammaproteobacteria bacterium]